MPYYCWRGVKLDASWCKGTYFARDTQTLERNLSRQEIALISYRQRRHLAFLPINADQKMAFFQHFHGLIIAGVHVWQALNIISEQVSDHRFAQIIDEVAVQVEGGKSLHDSFAQYSAVLSNQMIHVVDIGVQADNLPAALHMLCAHLYAKQEFKKKLRSALLLPMVTLGMFIAMLLVILFVIVPQYAHLFLSMSKELPDITRMLLSMSSFISSYYMIGSIFIIVTVVMVIVHLAKQPAYKWMLDKRLLSLPFIGGFFKQVAVVHFLRSLTLLLNGGMSIVPALKASREAQSNAFFKDQLQHIIDDVASGQELSAAMQNRSNVFGQDIILLITVGQEAGQLSGMMERACNMYQQKVERAVHRFTMIVQPILMIVLGLMVAGLIVAVYVPLFNLVDVI